MARKSRTPLESKRRNSARFSLYLSLVLLGVLVWVGSLYLENLKPTYTPPPWRGIDFEAL